MKKVTKILSLVLVLALIMTMSVVLFACGDEPNTTTPPTKPETTPVVVPELDFQLEVVDLDGEVLFNDVVYLAKEEKVLDGIKKVVKVDSHVEKWGTAIDRVNGSYLNAKAGFSYYVSLLLNDEIAPVGIDLLEVKEGDKVSFVIDSYGVSDVDKAIDTTLYKYAKNVLPKQYANRNAENMFSSYYYFLDSMIISLKAQGVKFDYEVTPEFENALNNVDYSKLKEADWGFLYNALVANGKDLAVFKTKYQEALNNVKADAKFNPYSTPFFVAPAKALNMTSVNYKKMIDATALAACPEQSPDGAVWTDLALVGYKEINNDLMKGFADKALGFDKTNCTSILTLLKANNLNDEASALAAEIVKLINAKTGYMHYDDKGSVLNTAANFSITQIYAALAAYRTSVLTNTVVNIL